MCNGVEQVGLAQSRLAVNEQGVEALRRLFRHRLGRGVGQLVLGAHHVGLKGEGVGIKQVSRPIRRHAVIGRQLLVAEDLYLQIGGEDVLQRRLDVGEEPGLHRVLLERIAAVQHQRRILHGHHGDLVKPGLDSHVGQLAAETGEDTVPQI